VQLQFGLGDEPKMMDAVGVDPIGRRLPQQFDRLLQPADNRRIHRDVDHHLWPSGLPPGPSVEQSDEITQGQPESPRAAQAVVHVLGAVQRDVDRGDSHADQALRNLPVKKRGVRRKCDPQTLGSGFCRELRKVRPEQGLSSPEI